MYAHAHGYTRTITAIRVTSTDRGDVDFAQPLGLSAELGGMQQDAQLDYEKLDVYRCAIEFCQIAFEFVRRLPRSEADLKSQLRRAAMSIPLNIAEGNGKPSGPDRARFNAIARGSAMECGAIVDVCKIAGYIHEDNARTAKDLLVRLVSMLSKMCR